MKRLIITGAGALACAWGAVTAEVSAQTAATFADPLELFSRMMPVFGHPRCTHCHGGVNPFRSLTMRQHFGQGAVAHGGGELEDRESCTDACHDSADATYAGWKLAPPRLRFFGTSTLDLCRLQSAEARGNHGLYLRHLATDGLIAAAFDGDRGGASAPSDRPSMSRDDFVQAAALWLQAGNAGCSSWTGIITQTETFASNYSFGGPEPHTTTAVNESARRVVKINREFGKTTADIEMSGHQVMTMTLRDIGPAAPCTTTMTSYHDWSNAGTSSRGPRPATVRFEIAENGSYVIHFTGGGDETTHTDERGTVVDGCASLLGPPDPSSIDLEWPPWRFNIRCPLPSTGPLALRRDLGESLDCDLYDAKRHPRLKGKLTRVVVDHSAAFDPQSWLAVSPIGISRADTGEQLPIRVVTEWDFVLVE